VAQGGLQHLRWVARTIGKSLRTTQATMLNRLTNRVEARRYEAANPLMPRNDMLPAQRLLLDGAALHEAYISTYYNLYILLENAPPPTRVVSATGSKGLFRYSAMLSTQYSSSFGERLVEVVICLPAVRVSDAWGPM
jgi:hypothetical protein